MCRFKYIANLNPTMLTIRDVCVRLLSGFCYSPRQQCQWKISFSNNFFFFTLHFWPLTCHSPPPHLPNEKINKNKRHTIMSVNKSVPFQSFSASLTVGFIWFSTVSVFVVVLRAVSRQRAGWCITVIFTERKKLNKKTCILHQTNCIY